MVRGAGVALKSLQLAVRVVEFGCAAVVIGIFSYFLAALSNHGVYANNYARAIEGISGAAVLYTIAGFLLVCCLGGFGFFAFVALILDILFIGGFIFIAYENRHAANSCSGTVQTIFGVGNTETDSPLGETTGGVRIASYKTTCKLQTAVFAVSVVACFMFLLSAALELAMWRHHKSEKKFGPSPNNNYTTGTAPRRFWQRKPKHNATLASGGLAAEKHHHDTLPAHTTPGDAVRSSYATDNTAVGHEPVGYKHGHVGNETYAAQGHPAQTTGVLHQNHDLENGAYDNGTYTRPHGTAVNNF